jgi:UDPglucose 6-dehydrogenase
MPAWNVIKKAMRGNIIVDGRNIYNRAELEEQGFLYTRIGER